eukprot:g4478.t1
METANQDQGSFWGTFGSSEGSGEESSEERHESQTGKDVADQTKFCRLDDDCSVAKQWNAIEKIDTVVKEQNAVGVYDDTKTFCRNSTFSWNSSTVHLPERKLFTYPISVHDGSKTRTRSLLFYADSSPLEVDVEEVVNQTGESDDYAFRVSFSKFLLNKPDDQLISCDGVVGPLQVLFNAIKKSDCSLIRFDLIIMREALSQFSKCNKNLTQPKPNSIVSVDGAVVSMLINEEQIHIDQLELGDKLNGTVVDVKLLGERGSKITIGINVNPDVGVSLFGGAVNSTRKEFNLGIEPPIPAPEPSVPSPDQTTEAPEFTPIQTPESFEYGLVPTPEPSVISPAPITESSETSSVQSQEAPESSPIQTPESFEYGLVPTPEPSVISPAPIPESSETSPASIPETPETSPAQSPELSVPVSEVSTDQPYVTSIVPIPDSPESSPVPAPEPSVPLPLQGEPSVPSTEEKPHSVVISEETGKTASIVTGTAAGVALVASVGTPMLVSFVSGGASGAIQAASSLSSIVDLLQSGQKAYLMTKLAVPNLPKNFIAFGQQFRWTMLDFSLPWKDDDSNTDEHLGLTSRHLLSKTTDREDDLYKTLRRAYFWMAICFVSLVLIHLIVIVFFFAYGKDLPGILRLPRLELYLLQGTIAVLTSGPAILFTGNTNQIIVGIVSFTFCVVPLLYWHLYILGKYVLNSKRVGKGIIYALNSVNLTTQRSNSHTPLIPDANSQRRIPREDIRNEGDHSWFGQHIWRVFFGSLYRSGEWTHENDEEMLTVDRHGAIFEDSRGKPVHLIENEQETNNADDQSRRYEEVPEENRYPIDVSEFSYTMRVCEKLFALVKMILITCLILGEDNPKSDSQAIALLTIHVVYLIYLRVIRPHCSRQKLITALIEDTQDIVIVLLVICRLNRVESHSHSSIGALMVALKGIAIALRILDIVLTTIPLIQSVRELLWLNRQGELARRRSGESRSQSSADKSFEERMYEGIRSAIIQLFIQPFIDCRRNREYNRALRHYRVQSNKEQDFLLP